MHFARGRWPGAETMPQRDDAPRDLLLGLLALQNGMVSHDQLVAAFAVWSAAAGRPFADLLAEQARLGPDEQALLAALVENHLKRHGNDPERSLAALDVQRSTRESLAAAGGPVVEATMDYVGSGSGSDGDAGLTSIYAVGTSSSDGQRFRVLRPHACGGLGAVFVALDGELHREVALKQILDHHADDPVSRQRFLLEAEITGGLEHPGIVPVYGLGTYHDGRPYYAMRFVQGDSLKEAIEHFHAEVPGRPDPATLELRRAVAAVPRRLQRHRVRPHPGCLAPRPQAGQRHRRPVRRDPGGGLGPGQAARTDRAVARLRRAHAHAQLGQRQSPRRCPDRQWAPRPT